MRYMLKVEDLIVRQHHDVNTEGRDFIIGDLHGCPAFLMCLLDHVKFDQYKDRIFSTGDLVDRGPDDIGSLKLLDNPWFYPVLGNHDAMLMAAAGRLSNRTYANAFYYNGGNMTQFDDFSDFGHYLDLLEKLPLIRVIGSNAPNRFQVLHAERAKEGGADYISDAELDGPIDTLQKKMHDFHWVDGFDMQGTWYDQLMWGRSLRYHMSNSDSTDFPMSRNFVGHTITVTRNTDILQYNQHVYLDTGAYMASREDSDSRFALTLWDVHNNMGFTFNNQSISEVKLVRLEDMPTI